MKTELKVIFIFSHVITIILMHLMKYTMDQMKPVLKNINKLFWG